MRMISAAKIIPEDGIVGIPLPPFLPPDTVVEFVPPPTTEAKVKMPPTHSSNLLAPLSSHLPPPFKTRDRQAGK